MLHIILLIFINLQVITCNIWDNIFTNLNSPHYTLKEEIKLNFYNDEKLFMRTIASVKLNMIRISLDDEEVRNLIAPQSGIIDFVIDFNNSTLSIDFLDNCSYKNISAIKALTTKFALEAYDLLFYYQSLGNYHTYTYTSALKEGMRSETNKNLRRLIDENEKVDSWRNLNYQNLNKMLNDIVEQNALIIIEVDKDTNRIENLILKTKKILVPLFMLTPKFDETPITLEDFSLAHKCTESK